MSIYKLKRNFEYTGGFVFNGDDSLLSISNAFKGKKVPQNLISHKFTVFPNNKGKTNYDFDFSIEGSFIILSERAYTILNHHLSGLGYFFDVNTDSKEKKYIGFFLGNIIKGALDTSLSVYKRYENGIVIKKLVLREDIIKENLIFHIDEDPFTIFINEDLKKIIEINSFQEFYFDESTKILTV